MRRIFFEPPTGATVMLAKHFGRIEAIVNRCQARGRLGFDAGDDVSFEQAIAEG